MSVTHLVLLDPRLKASPPSSWKLSTPEGLASWHKYKKSLDSEETPLSSIDEKWRSVEHQHIGKISRFYYVNDAFPKESYVYDCQMSLCPHCGV